MRRIQGHMGICGGHQGTWCRGNDYGVSLRDIDE
jgi:hypothetical protein